MPTPRLIFTVSSLSLIMKEIYRPLPTPIYFHFIHKELYRPLPTPVSQFHFINGALSALADSYKSSHSQGALSAHCRLLYHNFTSLMELYRPLPTPSLIFTSLLRRFTGPSLLLYIFSTLRSFIGPCRLLQLTAHVALPELADPHAKHLQLNVLRRGGKPPPAKPKTFPFVLVTTFTETSEVACF